MRVSHPVIDRIIDEQGWSYETVALLLWDFIEEQKLENELADFLEIRASDENGDNVEEE